jgi:hypothetical protein
MATAMAMVVSARSGWLYLVTRSRCDSSSPGRGAAVQCPAGIARGLRNKDDSGGLLPLGTSTTTSSVPTPTASAASPTPTAGPTRSSQKYGALTLVMDHSAQPPANAQAALRAYEDYERSSHKSMATNVEDPNLAKRSAGSALQDIRGVLKDQKATGVRTGGLITVTVKLVRALHP